LAAGTENPAIEFIYDCRGIVPNLPIMASTLILCAILLVSIFVFVSRKPKDKNGVPYRLPPGPKGWLIIGNTFQIPAKDQEPVLTRLTKKYGEMYADLRTS
jgi:hypothetical protein